MSDAENASEKEPVVAGRAVSEPGSPDSYWTPRRREIIQWLRSNAFPLAELYEGALKILFTVDFPGKLKFVAHAMREIVNRLPDAVGAVQADHVDYTGHCDRIEKDWVKHGLPTDGTVPGDPSQGTVSPSVEVAIPRPVYLKVAALVEDHLQRLKNVERAGQFLATIDPGDGDQARSAILAREWTGIGRWSVARAHLPAKGLNTNVSNAQEQTEEELRQEFEHLEAAIGAFYREFFKTTDELDQILEEANS